MGQFLSLVLCFMTLASHHINTTYQIALPTGKSWRTIDQWAWTIRKQNVISIAFCEVGQNLPHYIMMCLVYTTWMSCRGVGNGLISVIRARGWRYLLLALIDVEACILITSSHQFTSLASIQVCANDVIQKSNVASSERENDEQVHAFNTTLFTTVIDHSTWWLKKIISFTEFKRYFNFSIIYLWMTLLDAPINSNITIYQFYFYPKVYSNSFIIHVYWRLVVHE